MRWRGRVPVPYRERPPRWLTDARRLDLEASQHFTPLAPRLYPWRPLSYPGSGVIMKRHTPKHLA